MPRPPSLTPRSTLNLVLRNDLRIKLDILLWSAVEGRVPLGAYREFFEARLAEFFSEAATLNLAPFIPNTDPSLVVRGSPAAIERLKAFLQKELG